MSDRTFRVDSPTMKGADIAAWQQFLYDDFRSRWSIEYPIETDGLYGAATRAATASFMRAWGVEDTGEAMESGLTPEWRIKLRNSDRTPAEAARAQSDEIKDYRARLRARFEKLSVCYPVPNLITDDWGYHGTSHDGVDLICPRNQPVLAICRAEVIRAENGWSNLYAPAGDGIVILQSRVDDGPFFKGLCFGYGHAENFRVQKGDVVEAGQVVALAGFANATHLHFMANGGGFPAHIGHGDRDPMPYLDFAR
jgi:murein DD-endopeptidase MepM/ murein hydrolase activator NlpD